MTPSEGSCCGDGWAEGCLVHRSLNDFTDAITDIVLTRSGLHYTLTIGVAGEPSFTSQRS